MADPLRRLVGLLDREGAVRLLFGLNVAVLLGALALTRSFDSLDHHTYLYLGIGLLQGKYSFWHELVPYPPDTFRTPGYPLFLVLTSLGGRFIALTILVQCALHVAALALALRLVRRLVGPRPLARSLLLLLALLNAQFLYYALQTFPESIMVFMVTAYLCLELDEPGGRLGRHAAIGLLLGVMASVRPVAMLIPLARYALLLRGGERRQRLIGTTLAAAVAYAVLTPYALWNHQVHGKFSFTPVETSAPNREMGFWQLRLPGYTTGRYWRDNIMGEEIISPLVVSPAERARYIEEYTAQWDRIDRGAEPYLTDDDRRNLPLMRASKDRFTTFSTQYTLARSRLIEAEYRARVKEAPGYYLMSRAYTAVRQWVTGPRLASLRAPGLKAKIAAVYPTFITASCYLVGLPLAAWLMARRRVTLVSTLPFWLFGFVYWGAHVFMTIQSRYTVPMQLAALVLVACALASLREPPGPAPAA